MEKDLLGDEIVDSAIVQSAAEIPPTRLRSLFLPKKLCTLQNIIAYYKHPTLPEQI